MSSQQTLGLFLQLNIFTNDLTKSNKKSFDNKTELVFISKCFYGLETMKCFIESPTFLILQVLPLLHFKKKILCTCSFLDKNLSNLESSSWNSTCNIDHLQISKKICYQSYSTPMLFCYQNCSNSERKVRTIFGNRMLFWFVPGGFSEMIN